MSTIGRDALSRCVTNRYHTSLKFVITGVKTDYDIFANHPTLFPGQVAGGVGLSIARDINILFNKTISLKFKSVDGIISLARECLAAEINYTANTLEITNLYITTTETTTVEIILVGM